MKERIRIGRTPESDIHFDDPSVSTKHAMVITILSESFVQDLDSTNGTFINGNQITKQELKDRDIIRIGNWEMVYQQDEDEDSESEETLYDDSEGEKTIMVQRGPSDRTKNTKKFFLKLMSGPAAGKEYEMRKSLVTLGRPGKQVAVITRRPQGYFFTHVEGAGNLSINNEPIGPNARLLNNDDVIELAKLQIQVIIID